MFEGFKSLSRNYKCLMHFFSGLIYHAAKKGNVHQVIVVTGDHDVMLHHKLLTQQSEV